MIRFVAALTIAVFAVVPATAQIDEAPKVHARLIPETDRVAPGGTVLVALEENIRPGWHTYWVNPGDAGAPTDIQWTLPPGWRASSIEWPYPKKLPVGPLMDYGYEDTVWLLLRITAPSAAVPASGVQLKAAVSWLVCQDVCVPEDASLVLPLRISPTPGRPDTNTARQFQAARAKLPVVSPWPVRYALSNALDLFIAAPQLSRARPVSAVFFPLSAREIRSTAPQMLGFTPEGLSLSLVPSRKFKPGSDLSGVLVLTSSDGSVQAINVDARPGFVPTTMFSDASTMALVLALVSALLGGVILNLMPCVLPVLAIKSLALANHAGAGREAIRNEGLAYGAGAILSFAALGAVLVILRAGGAAVGWGFQLQEPAIVAGFALLMFAVGLNLSGVYEISPIAAGDALTRRGGLTGNFFTGVLAVAVAAPCTVPFMAAAVGYALTQSASLAIAVFVFLGLGFAAPFVLLGFWPVLQRVLPKPGAWMVTLRQILAFPMYAAAVWLIWVLGLQTNANGVALVLSAMVVMALSLWLWGATRLLRPRGRTIGAAMAGVVFVASLLPLTALRSGATQNAQSVRTTLSTAIPSEPFTQARLDELRRAHRAVFVNATAAWCITCLVNDERVLSNPEVRDAFARQHVAYLLADWTNRNGEITALLQAHGRSGVPLYLYYAPDAANPKILSQVLTVSEVSEAIDSGNAS